MSRSPLPVISPLVDPYSRKITYLRVSLTDRCNYRCTYCMPEEMVFLRRNELLSFEEIQRLMQVFVGLGVRRVRLTGGEPLVRADVLQLVERLHGIDGLDQLVMTTNGHRLAELAAPLAAAGLAEVNVSLDTLDPERFRSVTRRGDLDRVIAGIEASVAAGMRVKLNAVALQGINHDELVDLCVFSWDRGILPRFIEHMPMSDGQLYDPTQSLHAAQIRDAIRARFGELEPVTSADITGPARYWRVPGGQRFGIISAMSEHFCDTCNRVRLSAVGDLHTCLAFDDAVSLRDVLRAGGSDSDVEAVIHDALAGKRRGHAFQTTGGGAPKKHMIGIGG